MRRDLAYWLWIVLLAPASVAQEPVRIAELTESWGPTGSMVGLRDGLKALGYRENHEFFVAVRFTRGDLGALDGAAKDLVEQGVDLIVATGDNAALAALRATSRVPIVCVCNAVEIGAAQSFARPGGNLTGVTGRVLDLGSKRLQIFKELVPGLQRVLFAYHPADLTASAASHHYRAGARQLGIELVEKVVRTEQEAQAILAIRRVDVDGILAPTLPALDIPGTVLKLATQESIPAMFPGGEFWVERGALVSYGPSFQDNGRRAARLVDKILRGANPAEIPIERNPNVQLFLNSKVASALGLSIPRSLLLRADEVLE